MIYRVSVFSVLELQYNLRIFFGLHNRGKPRRRVASVEGARIEAPKASSGVGCRRGCPWPQTRFIVIVISPNSRLCSVWVILDISSLPWSYDRSLNMTRKSWKWKSPVWFICHFKGQTVSKPKVGLHVFPFWTAHFFVWTEHFGWTARLNYTMPWITINTDFKGTLLFILLFDV